MSNRRKPTGNIAEEIAKHRAIAEQRTQRVQTFKTTDPVPLPDTPSDRLPPRRKPRRAAQSTALVHQTAADLGFRAKVERELMSMAATCREKRATYRTPEYKADCRRVLEDAVAWLIERLPGAGDEADTEYEWGLPIIRIQDERYVMVAWRNRDDDFPIYPHAVGARP